MATSVAHANHGMHQTGLQNYYNLTHHNPQQQQSTPSSSSTDSPTSPPRWLPQQVQHQPESKRPPRSPLYVPAVLRAPNYYSNSKSHRRVESLRTPPPTSGSFSSIATDGNAAAARRSSLGVPCEGISRIVTEEWADESALGQVTGAPTRNHWQPDAVAPVCSSPPCSKPFSFLLRRHHCRRCGRIFCAGHSPHSVLLDQHARFHPRGTRQRACDSCSSDFKVWTAARKERLGSRAGSIASSDTPPNTDVAQRRGTESPLDLDSTPASPIVPVHSPFAPTALTGPTGAGKADQGQESEIRKPPVQHPVGSLGVGSVPPQWQWSTF